MQSKTCAISAVSLETAAKINFADNGVATHIMNTLEEPVGINHVQTLAYFPKKYSATVSTYFVFPVTSLLLVVGNGWMRTAEEREIS